MDLDPDVKRLAREAHLAFCEKLDELEQRRLAQMSESFRDFMDDLINHPLQRPWRESLDRFQEHHWRQDGMRLNAKSYDKVATLIERLLADRAGYARRPIHSDRPLRQELIYDEAGP